MENVNLIDLTNLVEAILGVLALIAMRYLVPWLKAKLSNEQEANLITIFEVAVMAAEKIYGAKKGDEKLAYVERQLEKRGIRLDTMRIKAYVNAAIKKMEQMEMPQILTTGEIQEGKLIEEETEDAEEEEPQTEEA